MFAVGNTSRGTTDDDRVQALPPPHSMLLTDYTTLQDATIEITDTNYNPS